jgi:N-acetylglutamate synthase-like GNAT family acetyltransferase
MAVRGRLLEIPSLPGFVAERDGEWLGHAAYQIEGDALEIALLESVAAGTGAASALLARCVALAQADGLRRVWLITTNDNVDALRYYQRRGFRLAALRRDAVTHARRSLKPEISEIGAHDIPIRDELELELPTEEWPAFVERYAWPQA